MFPGRLRFLFGELPLTLAQRLLLTSSGTYTSQAPLLLAHQARPSQVDGWHHMETMQTSTVQGAGNRREAFGLVGLEVGQRFCLSG